MQLTLRLPKFLRAAVVRQFFVPFETGEFEKDIDWKALPGVGGGGGGM